jgi:hypothetical protein
MKIKQTPLITIASIFIVGLASELVAAQHKRFSILETTCFLTVQINTATAQQEWEKFWPAFRTAVKKLDRVAIKRMMANPFDSGGGGDYSPDKWIRFLDREKAWGEIQRSVASGTKPFDEYSRDIRKPSRVTNRRHLIFIFSNGRWRWAAVMGD